LKVEFDNQVQEECHGGGQNMSLEGCAVKCLPQGSNQPRREFFTYLSDSKLQDSSTTHWHMSHLVEHLKEQNVLKENALILCNSDGCAGETVAISSGIVTSFVF